MSEENKPPKFPEGFDLYGIYQEWKEAFKDWLKSRCYNCVPVTHGGWICRPNICNNKLTPKEILEAL